VLRGVGRRLARELLRLGCLERVDLLGDFAATRAAGYRITPEGQRMARALAIASGDPHLALETISEAWERWPGAKKCPKCGCSPPWPCPVPLPPAEEPGSLVGDLGVGECVPAGVQGSELCSGCATRVEWYP